MKKIEDSAAIHFAINRWKPVPFDQFANILHGEHVDRCDEHGNDAILTKTYQLDATTTAVVYSKRKKPCSSIYSPFLMTVWDKRRLGAKLVAFEYIPEAYDQTKPLEVDPAAFRQ